MGARHLWVSDMSVPADWDGESYCTTEGCRNPASHEVLSAMADDRLVVELVCCHHAAESL